MARKKPRVPDKLFYRIGDVADLLGVKPYVLRYWESEFPVLSPPKSASGQRVYRRSDVETLTLIKKLLYVEKYSIEGARKRLGQARNEARAEARTEARAAAVETEGATPGLRTERIEQLRTLTQELRSLARTPLSKLFQL